MLINCRSGGGIVRQKPDAPSADEDDTMRREAWWFQTKLATRKNLADMQKLVYLGKY